MLTPGFIFRPKLKEHMQYCVDHPEEMNKLAKVQAQISEVKGVMMDNIEKVRDFHIIADVHILRKMMPIVAWGRGEMGKSA